MRTATRPLTIRQTLWLLGALVLAICLQTGAGAQTTYSKRTDEKLATRVHLPMGATTLAQVMTALSEQTGLHIIASDYLQDRKLIVQLDNLTAAAVLDVLSALNDWTWREADRGQILLTRPTIRAPQQISGIPLAMQAALPKDFRRYLGIGTPISELSVGGNAEAQRFLEAKKKVALQTKSPDAQISVAQWSVSARLRAHLAKQADLLMHSSQAALMDGKEVTYTKLSPEQKEALLTCLIVTTLNKTAFSNGFNLFHGVLRPYELNVADAELNLQSGNMLLLGSTTENSRGREYVGGGIQIDAPTSTVRSKSTSP